MIKGVWKAKSRCYYQINLCGLIFFYIVFSHGLLFLCTRVHAIRKNTWCSIYIKDFKGVAIFIISIGMLFMLRKLFLYEYSDKIFYVQFQNKFIVRLDCNIQMSTRVNGNIDYSTPSPVWNITQGETNSFQGTNIICVPGMHSQHVFYYMKKIENKTDCLIQRHLF